MKTLFYSLILLFLSTFTWAQQTVNYVSFFPSAHVVHNNITLTQNGNSFNPASVQTGENLIDVYKEQPGGLILGAAKEAKINVKEIDVNPPNGDNPNFIENIFVDNLLEVVANSGSIENIALGSNCTSEDDPNCQGVFISAGKLNYATESKSCFSSGCSVHTALSSGVAHIRSDSIVGAKRDNNAYKVAWVNLRLDGDEVCRPYLVRYTGTAAPANNCNEPS